ncbi:diguanylate cyclase domain-containing protein [Lebetimonas sp. JS138]|uniref:GGDEF domain-containing protein n=1 Tax=Lebetimonas sp. JS138 TaxID=990072 RepID=UPI000A0287A9
MLEKKLKPNRQEFIYQISKKINEKETYAFIIIDLKDFKIFNQINGLEAGDYILKKIAEFLKTFFHTEDIFGRIS